MLWGSPLPPSLFPIRIAATGSPLSSTSSVRSSPSMASLPPSRRFFLFFPLRRRKQWLTKWLRFLPPPLFLFFFSPPSLLPPELPGKWFSAQEGPLGGEWTNCGTIFPLFRSSSIVARQEEEGTREKKPLFSPSRSLSFPPLDHQSIASCSPFPPLSNPRPCAFCGERKRRWRRWWR